MKSISTALKAHIQGEVTTVCTCIYITRRDQSSFSLTDHDTVVTVDSVRYLPYDSYARTSVTNGSSLEVDSVEIDGILNSDAFARGDIAGGLFDFAEVSMFLVNYADPDMGIMNLRTGWIGEIEMNEDNTFHAEIRGLTQVFAYRVGDPYDPECDADLGDNRCKIGLDPNFWLAETPYVQGQYIIGHITAAEDYVNAACQNNDFSEQEDGTNSRLATGYVTYGSADGQWHFSSNWEGLTSPPGGALFAAITDQVGTNDTSALGMYQDIDLVDSGLTTEDIDLGQCICCFKGYVAILAPAGSVQLRLWALDENNVVRNIWDSGSHTYAEKRWITLTTSSTLIPAGTRKIRVDFYGHKNPTTGYGAAFGGFLLAFNDPNGTFDSDIQADGVMFQAQTSGVTGSTEPPFSVELGATYVDGGVTWLCVKSFKDITTVTTVTSNQEFTCTLPEEDDYYDGGLLIWETGFNTGSATQVQTWLEGVITLFEDTFYEIQEGDRFVIHPGCDKMRTTCVSKFNNILNFRGFPDVPGQDAYLQTPDPPSG